MLALLFRMKKIKYLYVVTVADYLIQIIDKFYNCVFNNEDTGFKFFYTEDTKLCEFKIPSLQIHVCGFIIGSYIGF